MTTRRISQRLLWNVRGATLPLVALSLSALIGFTGLEMFGRKRSIYYGADFLKRRRASRGKNLYGHISQRRGLRGPGQDFSSSRVGSELVQQPVLRSATDNANLPNVFPNHVLQISENKTVFEREALKNGSDIRARILRNRLVGPGAKLIDGSKHILRPQERLVVGINQMTKGRRNDCQLNQFTIVVAVRLRCPGLPAASQHPQSHDVLQQSRCSIHATFVGEVQPQRIGCDHWGIQFRAQ